MEAMIIFVTSLTIVNFVHSILLTKRLDGIVEEICEEINHLETSLHHEDTRVDILKEQIEKRTTP